MPKRHRQRNRTMRGGFLDTLSNWGSSLSQGASNLWDKTKNATSSATSSLTESTPTTSTYPTTTTNNNSQPMTTSNNDNSQPMTTSTYGGKSRKRKMRGGFRDNTPTTGLASNAASFSGQTAKAHNMVGGKTRRHRKHKHSKSCNNRKH